MLNRIDVQNNPVNWIDPWGLSTLPWPRTGPGGTLTPDGKLKKYPAPDLPDISIPSLGDLLYAGALALICLSEEDEEEEEEERPPAPPVDKTQPPNHPDFVPHKKKKGLQKIPWNKDNKGYPDKQGNYWEPVPDGHKGTHDPHWDVQHKDGTHTPKYPPRT